MVVKSQKESAELDAVAARGEAKKAIRALAAAEEAAAEAEAAAAADDEAVEEQVVVVDFVDPFAITVSATAAGLAVAAMASLALRR